MIPCCLYPLRPFLSVGCSLRMLAAPLETSVALPVLFCVIVSMNMTNLFQFPLYPLGGNSPRGLSLLTSKIV